MHNSPCKLLQEKMIEDKARAKILELELLEVRKGIAKELSDIKLNQAVFDGKFDMYIKLKEGELFLNRIKANENPGDWNTLLKDLKKDKNMKMLLKILALFAALIGGILTYMNGGF